MSDISLEMYNDFSNVISNENTISCDSVLEILKKYASTVSVFDLMAVNAKMIKDSEYVQKSYKDKGHKVYAKYFLGRLKYISGDETHYSKNIDKEEFIDAIATLKSYHMNGTINNETKFPLIYGIVSLYTTFVLEEPIHPVGTPFPGSLEVEEIDGPAILNINDAIAMNTEVEPSTMTIADEWI